MIWTSTTNHLNSRKEPNLENQKQEQMKPRKTNKMTQLNNSL